MQELRDEHFNALQILKENFKSQETVLRGQIRSLEHQLETEQSNKKAEMEQLKSEFEERKNIQKQQFETNLAIIRMNLEDEAKKVDQRNNQINELNLIIENKKLEATQMEADKWELEQKCKSLDQDLEELTNNYSKLNTEFKFLSELKKSYEEKIETMGEELKSTSAQLDTFQQMYIEATGKISQLNKSLVELQEAFEQIKSKYDHALDDLSKLSDENDYLTKTKVYNGLFKITLEKIIIELHETINSNLKTYQDDMELKLEQQKEHFDKIRDEYITAKINKVSADKDALLAQRQDEIHQLNKNIEVLHKEHENTINETLTAAELLKSQNDDKFNSLSQALEGKTQSLQKANETIEEKDKLIHGHLSTIQSRESTIKSLEVDMADLFQKMVQCDKQIRNELNERFTKEKFELEAQWTAKQNLELQALSATLEREHREKGGKQEMELKNQFQEELDNVHATYRVKIGGIMQEMADKESNIQSLRKEVFNLEQKIKENNYLFEEKEQAMNDEFQNNLQHAKEEWQEKTEEEINQLETKYKALINELEGKHQSMQAESSQSHKKQVDELRNFFSVSTANAKKEFETQKLLELTSQRVTYENTIAGLKTKHEADLDQLRSTLADQKMQEMNELTDQHDRLVSQLTEDYDTQFRMLKELETIESNLREQLATTENDLKETKHEVVLSQKEIQKKAKDFEHKTELKRQEFEKNFNLEKEKLQMIHIQELQTMIQEFEKAKNFLKSQIASFQKQLEEAAEKYINREPRDVDVETIAHLNSKCEGYEQQIHLLNQELKTYRLEMNNRELAFNKIFNNVPLVGMMQTKVFYPLILTSKSQSKKKLHGSQPKLPPLEKEPLILPSSR